MTETNQRYGLQVKPSRIDRTKRKPGRTYIAQQFRSPIDLYPVLNGRERMLLFDSNDLLHL
jgi:hypothetical protein